MLIVETIRKIRLHTTGTGKRGRFFNVVDLVDQLEQEKLAGRGGRLAATLALWDLAVLDETEAL